MGEASRLHPEDPAQSQEETGEIASVEGWPSVLGQAALTWARQADRCDWAPVLPVTHHPPSSLAQPCTHLDPAIIVILHPGTDHQFAVGLQGQVGHGIQELVIAAMGICHTARTETAAGTRFQLCQALGPWVLSFRSMPSLERLEMGGMG